MHNIHKLLIVLLLLTIAGCKTEPTSNVLIVGLSPDYPPFEYMSASKVVGFDVELSEHLAKLLGKELVIKDMEFPALIPSLKTNKIDFAISGLTKNDTREQSVTFSTSYYNVKLAAIFKKGNDINSVTDLENKTIGTQTGSSLEAFAKTIPGINLLSLDNNLHLVQELINNKIDLMLCESSQAKAFIKKQQSLDYADIDSVQSEYAIALKHDNPLVNDINTALNTLKQNGTLTKLEQKWLYEHQY